MILEIDKYLIDINSVIYIHWYTIEGKQAYAITFIGGHVLEIYEATFPLIKFIEKYKEAKGIK